MFKIDTKSIGLEVEKAFSEICTRIDDEVMSALAAAERANPLENFALDITIKNAEIAKAENCAVCQDTGMAVVFLDVGQNVELSGNYVEDEINDGIRRAYARFRKSVLTPLSRKNTGDNTPAVIHTRIIPGNRVEIGCIAKGFGSENMSAVYMLTPADGTRGIIDKVVETVKRAGGCPCPPVIVGVGIGGTMEKAAVLSKHALLRPINTENKNLTLAVLEQEILDNLNSLNIGAQGFKGANTALKVLIETYPTHIAGLPLAVTVQCHCSRHKTVILEGK
jgi:hydro-lyases, Fe-S type, tartrate/fumarate subfamily, alpha region